jgi:hypothetical protein
MRLFIAIMLLFQYTWDILYTMHPKSFIYEKKETYKKFQYYTKIEKKLFQIFLIVIFYLNTDFILVNFMPY